MMMTILSGVRSAIRRVRAVALCLAVVLSLAICYPMSVAAQPPTPTAEVFIPPAGWTEAAGLLRDLRTRASGVEKLYDIAGGLPKSEQRARCLALAAFFDQQQERALSVYRSLVEDYPGTAREIEGRAGIIAKIHPHRLTDRNEGAAFVQAAEMLLKQLGAPTLSDMRKSRGDCVRRFQGFSEDRQLQLAAIYVSLHELLSGLAQRRNQEALPLALFGLEAMGNSSGYDDWLARVEIDRKRSGQTPALEGRTSNPIVQVIKPYDLKMGTRGQISIRVFRGEYLSSSTVPELIRVLLDGQDITQHLSITKVWTKSTTGSSDLETFLVQGRPAGSLAPGVHVLEVNAESVGYRGGSNPGRTRLVTTLLVDAGREEEAIRDR